MPSGIFLKKMPPCTISKWQLLNRNRSSYGRDEGAATAPAWKHEE
jgi:hypothetical protein